MDAEIVDRTQRATDVIFELTDRDVTGIAQETADLSRPVIVVDAEILKERVVVPAFERRTVAPISATDCTTLALILEERLKGFG